jgi:putative copper resistance protein D
LAEIVERLLSDPLIAARAVHFASTVAFVGAIAFGALVAEPAFRSTPAGSPANKFRRQLAWIAWIGLGLAVVSGAAWLVLLAAEISGRPLARVFDGDVVRSVLTRTRFGTVWSVRLVLAILLAGNLVLSVRARHAVSPWHGALSASLAAALVGSLAWAGHAAGTPGLTGKLHVIGDALHLIAAAVWVGGLLPLALLFAAGCRGVDPARGSLAREVTRRFSMLGVVSVGTIFATGLLNTYVLVGSVPALLETDYGELLLVKIGLFIAMVCIAAVNRLRLSPRLASTKANSNAVRQLQRNTLIEAAVGLVILGIVGVLGTLPPAIHAVPSLHMHQH